MEKVKIKTIEYSNVNMSKCNCGGSSNCNCGSGSICAHKCANGKVANVKKELKKIYKSN